MITFSIVWQVIAIAFTTFLGLSAIKLKRENKKLKELISKAGIR